MSLRKLGYSGSKHKPLLILVERTIGATNFDKRFSALRAAEQEGQSPGSGQEKQGFCPFPKLSRAFHREYFFSFSPFFSKGEKQRRRKSAEGGLAALFFSSREKKGEKEKKILTMPTAGGGGQKEKEKRKNPGLKGT